jgi:sulfur-oxidizing protein SoxZ
MATINKFPIRVSFVGNPKPGASVEVRILIGHPMETGFRMADNGIDQIPKNIIEKVLVKLNQELIFEADVGTGIAANPLISFLIEVPEKGGVISVNWLDDHGNTGQIEKELISFNP